MATGKQTFDRTIYGSSGGGGGGTKGQVSFMGSPAQISQHYGFGRKNKRSKSRSKRK